MSVKEHTVKQYIAIDNVCAWPNIKKLPGGEIIAIMFNQPCHLRWEGAIDCWAGGQDGLFWEFRSNPVLNDPGTNRGNVAVGLNAAGEIIVLCSGWNNVLPRPEWANQAEENDDSIRYHLRDSLPLWPVPSLSKDGGRTWEVQDIKVDGSPTGVIWIPYGDILAMDDGRLACSMYCSRRSSVSEKERWQFGSYYLESADNGLTWQCVACIYDRGNETALVRLPSGKMLAAVRSDHLDLYESTDAGGNWRHVTFLTGRREFPAGFTLLREGSLLLTYGIRHKGLYGLGAQLMRLEDETWGHPMLLADFGDTHDGGYPSNLQLENGDIVTAYYARSVPSHNRYHMGVLIWNLKDHRLA